MKKHILICLTVLLLPCIVEARIPCDDGEENCWECGQDCTARFDPLTKTFHVAGTGNMANLAIDGQAANVPWHAIRSSVKNLSFEGSINSFSTYAFYNMPIENVTIPDSVTSIGFGAFYKCNLLKNVTIPNSVTTISTYAFANTNLDSIIIPDSVTNVSSSNFLNNPDLTSIVIGDHTSIIPFNEYDINEELKIYCTGDLKKCKSNAGRFADKVIQATAKTFGGVTYVYDQNGNLCAQSGTRIIKRIYTIDEATSLVSPTGNTFMLRYR